MDAVLAFVPEEERIQYSAMTGQSLYYMGETDLKHKVLAVVEGEGASRASYALKLLQREGSLSIASTGKDATIGKLVTHEYRVGRSRHDVYDSNLTDSGGGLTDPKRGQNGGVTAGWRSDETRTSTGRKPVFAVESEKRILRGVRDGSPS